MSQNRPKPKKKQSPFNRNAAIRGALRRLFARSPAVREALQKTRREVPKYRKDGSLALRPAVQHLCAVCSNWVGSTKVTVDHREPVVSVNEGFIDWNVFVDRLFCSPDNLQVICDGCHGKKTYGERIARLIIQYTDELNLVEQVVNSGSFERVSTAKTLAKYVSKKKTPGLEMIAERARLLKARILTSG